jgi:hypothetical protein
MSIEATTERSPFAEASDHAVTETLAPGPFYCRVDRSAVGQSGAVLLMLTDTAGRFNGRWFRAAITVPREMLAIALTAISTGRQIVADLDSPDTEYSNMSGLQIVVF